MYYMYIFIYIYVYICICICVHRYIYIYLYMYNYMFCICIIKYLCLYSQNGGMDASHMSDYMEKINGPGHKMSPLQVRSILGQTFMYLLKYVCM
jgi:hypothetical protein